LELRKMEKSGMGIRLGKDCMIHPTATIIGDIETGERCSFWPGSVTRADIESIKMGSRVNVQDNVTIHVDYGFPTIIGDDTTIGHNSVVHGCKVGKLCIVGIGAVILNGAIIGEGSVIGAGAVVTSGTEIPPNSLVMGIPGKVKKTGDFVKMALENSTVYADLADEFMKGSFPEYRHPSSFHQADE
jgi:carbonic anhydrase/acetyltransferase-like protein (isoleucine patch superfamily)